MSLIRITNGTVYDPANGVHGEIRDLWIQNGKIVAPPSEPNVPPDRTLDATGLIIMPGGVDIHAHIAGPKVNAARKMRPEDHRLAPPVRRTRFTRSGVGGSVPSTFATGYLYAGMGYTTVMDAAISPLAARHAHEELADTPIIDKGFYVLMGNNHYVLRQIASGNYARLRDFAAWLLGAAKAYAIKLVNPGGVEIWKEVAGGNATHLDEAIPAFGVTPRQIIQNLAQVAMDLRLPHAVHIHCNNLGLPGNWTTTLDTMKALEGRRGHLTHIQFHSYGGDPNDQRTFCSQAEPLINYFNEHPNLTVDVGQVMFGETTSMTGDGPLGYYLHRVTGRKWFNADTEMETGCGIVPITYREKSVVHAWQWVVGLEWFLLAQDPWRICLSTDHPNGASFLAYPQIIHLLMDAGYRRDMLQRLPSRVRERCRLRDISRQYSLSEIAIITRAAPARILGLTNKGHLGVGADADITIYQPQANLTEMFAHPRYVFKAGQLIVEDGEIRAEVFGKTHYNTPEFDQAALPDIQRWFEDHYTIQFANYPVDVSYLEEASHST
ncbi:MAG: formylmethanofuran dehydrogenase subunit A [Gemmatales bacterium]|nr:formylmethanofuran dehydrogenase subunit A [Gemmatales bacterium]MDW7994410.1 formylmethanofuran dehydrogenase subunit A [Gemmatales bacterium]